MNVQNFHFNKTTFSEMYIVTILMTCIKGFILLIQEGHFLKTDFSPDGDQVFSIESMSGTSTKIKTLK